MFRKTLCSIIIVFMFINTLVYASDDFKDDKTDKIIKYISVDITKNENETITRGECITAIMKILGTDEKAAAGYSKAVYDQPVFSDLNYDDQNMGYIIIAKFSDVAVGIKMDKYDDIHSFESERDVTVKECLTFMLRCLGKRGSNQMWFKNGNFA